MLVSVDIGTTSLNEYRSGAQQQSFTKVVGNHERRRTTYRGFSLFDLRVFIRTTVYISFIRVDFIAMFVDDFES